MKKIISTLMILTVCALAVGLSACGEKQPAENQTTASVTQESQSTQEAGTAAAPASDTFTFNFKGTGISMKADAEPILAGLGECKSYTEETSCAFDGLDKNYTYTSFIMTTYPDGDKDRVNSLTLRDDTVSTAEGISIGDSKEKVESVYGADAFNGINAYIMADSTGDSQLTVILDGDKVSSIQYAALFD